MNHHLCRFVFPTARGSQMSAFGHISLTDLNQMFTCTNVCEQDECFTITDIHAQTHLIENKKILHTAPMLYVSGGLTPRFSPMQERRYVRN